MRHAKFMPEEPLAEDPAMAELSRTLAILKPIRRQRLSRAERELREEQARLAELATRLENDRAALQEHRRQHWRERADLLAEYQAEAKPVARLQDWSNREKGMIGALAQREQQLDELKNNHGRQEQRIDSARQTVIISQRDVEKLDYLTKNLGAGL
ncbi:hypothetical protein BZL41_02220 [Pseudomonas sp. PIC25]|uniref:YscO family type III secretion system apparatus protein n=1 Tax=Pseudomonas sp. PIC25 TaxID=1958773 RepID=UPI000BABADE2|nr:YscO family type III secretion system apparatus protein [Pseudomonas sp. PIC25]PAU66300.1 hypothetical protein BZL41_02220 [Pseudomonas sp. PIC25]